MPLNSINALFINRSLILTERILGLCDRNAAHDAYGCFDRYFWCYKLHDTANLRFQEAVLFLALGRRYYPTTMHNQITKLLTAGLLYWANARHSDGSVDEIYPFERSFCATAMSTQALTGAYLRTENILPIDFTKTGDFLAANQNEAVANQMAGACLALARIARITGNSSYAQAAWHKFQQIEALQLPNGCYQEYGGPDIGYATITLALLSGYHALTPNERVLESMRACEHFLLAAVDEDGLFEWQGMSRRTQFLYPSGLAYLKSDLLPRLGRGLKKNVIINPLWMDDRYCIPLAADYLLAAEYLNSPNDTRGVL